MRRIHILEKIQKQLAAQLASHPPEVQLLLDLEELQELLNAMFEFVKLVKRMFPQNKERDSVIESINACRLRLMHIISEFAV